MACVKPESDALLTVTLSQCTISKAKAQSQSNNFQDFFNVHGREIVLGLYEHIEKTRGINKCKKIVLYSIEALWAYSIYFIVQRFNKDFHLILNSLTTVRLLCKPPIDWEQKIHHVSCKTQMNVKEAKKPLDLLHSSVGSFLMLTNGLIASFSNGMEYQVITSNQIAFWNGLFACHIKWLKLSNCYLIFV